MKEIILDYIGGNKTAQFTDQMMHYADMFEQGKRFAIYKQMSIIGDPDLNKLCEIVKKALEDTDNYVLFLSIRSIDGIRTKEFKPLFEKGIHTISTIQNDKLGWILFADMLKALGYEVKTNKNMMVASIK